VTYFDGCDEPSFQPSPLLIPITLKSQPGRWVARQRPLAAPAGHFLVTHPDSWLFLRELFPSPFRRLPLYPELFYHQPFLQTLPSKWLVAPNGLTFSISSYGAKLDPQVLEFIHESGARALPQPPAGGLLLQCRLAELKSFRFWCLLTHDHVAQIASFLGLPLDTAISINEKEKNKELSLLAQLLYLRELYWQLHADDFLAATRVNLPTLGGLLGWLNFNDRQFLVQWLYSRMGAQAFRALFYEKILGKHPLTILPDPHTSFPLVLDSLPRLFRESWRSLRLIPAHFEQALEARLEELWTSLCYVPNLIQDFSAELYQVLHTHVFAFLIERHQQRHQRLGAKLVEWVSPQRSSFYKLFKRLNINTLARAFFDLPQSWRQCRTVFTVRIKKRIEEEMAYYQRLQSTNCLNWKLMCDAKYQALELFKDYGFVNELENI